MNNPVNTSSGDKTTEAADGSALYYALLYIDKPASTRAMETLQFIHTLSGTLNDVTEGQVAEKKIHWWHEELARQSKQQSRHPAGVAVQNYLHNKQSIESSLTILSATATERYAPAATEQELKERVLADYGARLTLLEAALSTTTDTNKNSGISAAESPISFRSKTEILSDNDVSLSQKSNAIAFGLGQFDRLNSLIHRLRCGYPVFSDETYKHHELTPDDLLSHAATDSNLTTKNQGNVNALLASAIADTHTSLENATQCIRDLHQSDPTSLAVQILCEIRCAQVRIWKKRKPNLLNESLTLTPLRKFIIAYRCKRRFK